MVLAALGVAVEVAGVEIGVLTQSLVAVDDVEGPVVGGVALADEKDGRIVGAGERGVVAGGQVVGAGVQVLELVAVARGLELPERGVVVGVVVFARDDVARHRGAVGAGLFRGERLFGTDAVNVVHLVDIIGEVGREVGEEHRNRDVAVDPFGG